MRVGPRDRVQYHDAHVCTTSFSTNHTKESPQGKSLSKNPYPEVGLKTQNKTKTQANGTLDKGKAGGNAQNTSIPSMADSLPKFDSL